ncbi:uncharacterized protein LOC132280179 isoform X2 [Cornus florida]|uniref:uncharacterized protein LOC132280179 isoform X2 n=1 Tax=Cornus florida TaxID=4283 RepID=UPI0028991155|nr:uncharacterized protein LOC132280179 isoform X2 [Cornus florida]
MQLLVLVPLFLLADHLFKDGCNGHTPIIILNRGLRSSQRYHTRYDTGKHQATEYFEWGGDLGSQPLGRRLKIFSCSIAGTECENKEWKFKVSGGYSVSSHFNGLRAYSTLPPPRLVDNDFDLNDNHSFLVRSGTLISAGEFVSKLEGSPRVVYMSLAEYENWLSSGFDMLYFKRRLMENSMCVVETGVELVESVRYCKRELRDSSFVCAYVDGSFDPKSHEASIGVVFVDVSGKYLYHISERIGRVTHAEEAELNALTEAVSFAKWMRWSNLVVYSDCLNMVNGLREPPNEQYSKARKKFPETYAERNKAADYCSYAALRNHSCDQKRIEKLVFQDHTMMSLRFVQKKLSIKEFAGKKVVTADGVVVS